MKSVGACESTRGDAWFLLVDHDHSFMFFLLGYSFWQLVLYCGDTETSSSGDGSGSYQEDDEFALKTIFFIARFSLMTASIASR